MTKKRFVFICVLSVLFAAALSVLIGFRTLFPRPYLNIIEQFDLDPDLVLSVMKAESGFDENAISNAGASGVMQIKPSTAQYICEIDGVNFEAARLFEGAYNTELGCRYLRYLFKRFSDEDTAIAAYNAGEGTVSNWLNNAEYSADGVRLTHIPYEETDRYVKKIKKFKKIYEIFY